MFECIFIMPWGKHKGESIDELPSNYLKWLAENCNADKVGKAADDEYCWRSDHNKHFED